MSALKTGFDHSMNTANPASELIDAIRSVVDIEFFRVSSEPSTSELPLLIWRYVNKEGMNALLDEITAIIEQAVAGRRVQWELRYSGRNWVLAPKRFHELEDSQQFRMFPEILRYLERTDPEFTRSSHLDFEEIAAKAIASMRDLSRNLASPH